MFDDDMTIDKHESYGMVSFSRVSHGGGKCVLFGSSIDHQYTVTLKISKAEKHRSLSNDWYFDKEQIIEVEMSNDQFAELITTLNCGSGVPCTLRYIQGKEIEKPHYTDKRAAFENEFKKRAAEIVKDAEMLQKNAKACLEDKTVSKVKLREAVNNLGSVIMQIKNSLPFIYDQFNESMDKTVVEAKAETEAFVNHAITSTGLATLKGQMPILSIEKKKESE